MADVTIKRTGGWCVELQHPLTLRDGSTVDKLEIKQPTFGVTVRWGNQEIPSWFALFSELCGVGEMALRQLIEPDFSNAMLGFTAVLPSALKTSFGKADRPLTTADLHDDDMRPQPQEQPQVQEPPYQESQQPPYQEPPQDESPWPEEEPEPETTNQVVEGELDEQDPHFPKFDGPIKRFKGEVRMPKSDGPQVKYAGAELGIEPADEVMRAIP